MSKKDKVLEIYGFQIYKDSLYEIQEKKDSSAPDGFQEHNTTKDLSFDAEDSVPGAVFDVVKNIWDTGLTEHSSALAKAIPNEQERKAAIVNLNTHIVNKYEKIHGENRLDFKNIAENDNFWLDYRINLKRGKVFNTSKVEDLLDLYFCLVFKRLTPKELESHPSFKQPISSFIVVDKETATTRKAENEIKKMEAIAAFHGLLNQNQKDLISILNSLNINVSESTDKTTLVTVFNNWLEDKTDKYQNTNQFLESYSKYTTEEGKEYFYILGQLKKLQGKGVSYKQGDIYIQDVFIASGWSNAATTVQKDKEFTKMLVGLDK